MCIPLAVATMAERNNDVHEHINFFKACSIGTAKFRFSVRILVMNNSAKFSDSVGVVGQGTRALDCLTAVGQDFGSRTTSFPAFPKPG